MNKKIAIIGMSGLFPGSSTNEEFWNNLMQKKDLTSLATKEDFGTEPQQFFHPEKGIVDKCYSLRGGYIRDFQFDADGYEMSADFLAKQDKLYQWSLYVAKEALEESGYLGNKEVLKKCGLVLGNLSFPTGSSHRLLSSVYTQTTEKALQELLQDPDFKIAPNQLKAPDNEVLEYTPSEMVTKALGLGATHYALDAACATSLYAIKLACDELQLGKTDLMLAGAVCGSDQLFIHMGFSIFHAYAPADKSFVPLDKTSAGLVSSEGAGMVVLKRLEDAQRDGDNILAVIGGIGLSNDGRGKFLLSPHPKGQRLAFERAYQGNDISPKNTSYLECHATGTPLGDKTEINSIANFFKDYKAKPLLGSVKSNMGHLLTAAGMTGLLKVLLAMQKEVIPANINLKKAVEAKNNWIGREEMILEATSWKDEHKQAGINSFGFGGTNAHMVVQNGSKVQRFKGSKVQGFKSSIRDSEPSSFAIVGMDIHFGDCTNLADFYETIYHGKQHFKELPKSRWKGFEENANLLRKYGFENGKAPKGAYIEDFEIDLLRYKIQPKEAETLESQQALILKVADNALKDAGLAESQNVAVLIAMESELAIHHYLARWDVTWQLKNALEKSGIVLTEEQQKELEEVCKNAVYFREGSQTPSQHTSFVGNIMASRIAALWDFSGPAFTVSCGDNSVFKALEIAQNMLAMGEVEAVVVGGVDFSGGLENVLLRNKDKKVNLNEKPSLFFNHKDEGWLIGEGAGAIVLKRADEVKEEKVYAVIDGKNGIQVTYRFAAQDSLRNKSLSRQNGKVSSEYRFSHQNLPDYIEINQNSEHLMSWFSCIEMTSSRNEKVSSQYKKTTAIGSIETNIGHTFAASGIASIIKTALCLKHRFIPAIPNWRKPKNEEFWENSSFYFPTEAQPWLLKEGKVKRTAAVIGEEGLRVSMEESVSVYSENIASSPSDNLSRTSFGAGEIFGRSQTLRPSGQGERNTIFSKNSISATSFLPQIIPLKAPNQKALQRQLSALEIALATKDPLRELAKHFYEKVYQLVPGKYVLCLVASSKTDLQTEINFFKKTLAAAFAKNKPLKTPKGSYFTPNPLSKKGKVAFVYPGSSTAYAGMGKDLFQVFPELHQHFDSISPHLDQFIWSDYLYPKTVSKDEPTPNIYQNAIAMMSVGVFHSAAYSHILRKIFSVEPDIAFGYSMGECSSMWYSLGLWSANNTSEFRESPIFKNQFSGDLNLLAEHWEVSSEEAKERWVSLVLLAPVEKVREKVKALKELSSLFITFINTSNEVVISGDRQICLAIAQDLKCPTIELPFQNIIHHDFCKKEYEGLIKMHHFPLEEKPNIDFYSSITLDKIPLDSQTIAENSTTVCYQQVNFPKTVEKVYEEGARIFIEVGANATCTGWINTILKDKEHHAVSINYKGKSDAQAITELLAQLLSHGVEVNLSRFYPSKTAQTKQRSFMKKIIPGGQRIYDLILSEKMKKQFEKVEKKELVLAGGEDDLVFFNKTDIDFQVKTSPLTSRHVGTSSKGESILLNPSLMDSPLEPVPNYREVRGEISFNQPNSQTFKPSTNMQTTIEAPSKSKIQYSISNTSKIGENGLLIHDFSTGEHLKGKEIIFTQEDLEEFATGKIANVFGKEYAIIDSYRRRVMLPMYPYLLVSRVTGLKGKIGEYKPSFMQTEYDIPHGAWFTTDRQIPWAVSVESGQCDLLLISYLGIDFQNKGNLVYRLLDCTLTFVDDLPFEGQTLRYDISINSFVRNGDNLLFFFSYRCYVQDRLVLKMDGGCAGFFTDEQLEEGNGVVYTDKEIAVRKNAKKRHFTPLLTTHKTTFTKTDLQHLINGDIEKCFENEAYFANGRNPSLCLPPEQILMIDRITEVDIHGGAYGLGYIVAEKDLYPDDWYFPCHFRDDEVLAGSLQAEGGGNLLRFFMLMLGLQRLTKDARYQPVFDLPQKVRCRKQVTPKDTKLIYKLEIKEIGLIPNPYVIGDLEIISDGVVTVHFENLGLQLREKSNPRYLEKASGKTGIIIPERSKGALLNEKDITTFALDDLSKCFGEEFSVYDGRKVSRQPNTDLQLISRVLKIDGQRGYFKKPSTTYAEYDVPKDVWYYEQNSAITMPYSVLMEIALQPCGLMGAYLGSTLQFPNKNLYFRNLDGTGEMLELPSGTDFRGKTIHNKAVLVSSVALGGTILQNYTFELSVDGQVFYKGKSSFGFFPGEALAEQVGLDNGKEVEPWYLTEGLTTQQYMQIKLDSLYGKMKLFKAPAHKPHYHLAGNQLRLLDKLIIAKNSGKYGKGYIHATKFIKPYEWFFTCHFYQDPVMPGSLGVEAILQAMQVFALQQDLGKDFKNPKFVQLPNHKTVWKYRGQILTDVKEMYLEVHIKTVEKRDGLLAIIGDAYLWNGKTRIYQVTDLGLGIV